MPRLPLADRIATLAMRRVYFEDHDYIEPARFETIVGTLIDLTTKYPLVKPLRIAGLAISLEIPDHASAATHYDKKRDEVTIGFNPRMWGPTMPPWPDKKTIDRNSGLLIGATGDNKPDTDVTHEYGHALMYSILETKNISAQHLIVDIMHTDYNHALIAALAGSRFSRSTAPSAYSLENTGEFFAEVFLSAATGAHQQLDSVKHMQALLSALYPEKSTMRMAA